MNYYNLSPLCLALPLLSLLGCSSSPEEVYTRSFDFDISVEAPADEAEVSSYYYWDANGYRDSVNIQIGDVPVEIDGALGQVVFGADSFQWLTISSGYGNGSCSQRYLDYEYAGEIVWIQNEGTVDNMSLEESVVREAQLLLPLPTAADDPCWEGLPDSITLTVYTDASMATESYTPDSSKPGRL